MPELPEVETVCRVMRHALVGKRITRVEVVPDAIVFSGFTPAAIETALLRRTVRSVGRRGKFFWLTLTGAGPTVFGHLGMSGWVRAIGVQGTRSWLFEHRWGGTRGASRIAGQPIVREEVGGRTTAWVPSRQK